MKIIDGFGKLDFRDSMYPSVLIKFKGDFESDQSLTYSTIFGVCSGSGSISINGKSFPLYADQFFSVPVKDQVLKIKADSWVALMVRLGFQGQTIFGGMLERTGRLSYIDGCSDSTIIFPPRYGDASLNLLYFPTGTDQSFHTHPSLRLGCVVSGHGIAETRQGQQALKTGDAFVIEENEMHRFRTESSEMRVVAYHPESDFGPTDRNHAMINRTYLKGV